MQGDRGDYSASSAPFSGLRGRLHESGPLFFAQTMLPDADVASILGGCGFDFVMIDAEHGPFTLKSLRACIVALKSTSTPAVVRTASQNAIEIKQVLDLGADGVMIPRIESAKEAVAVIRAARYPPEGIRGVSHAVRASRFGLDEDYVRRANARVAAIAIIESARGVQHIEEVVRTPGLDGIMVGGDDLCADLNVPWPDDNPKFLEAVEKVVAVSRSAGLKVGGRMPRSPEEHDSTLIHCGNDAIVLRTALERVLALQRSGNEQAT